MCEILARSMKEYERRPTERTGFTEHPADCLAFKYLRDVSGGAGRGWGRGAGTTQADLLGGTCLCGTLHVFLRVYVVGGTRGACSKLG